MAERVICVQKIEKIEQLFEGMRRTLCCQKHGVTYNVTGDLPALCPVGRLEKRIEILEEALSDDRLSRH